MNKNRFVIVSLLSFFLGLFGCESKKEISFSDFKSGAGDSVLVVFEEGEIKLGDLLFSKTSVRLRSKITTVFTSVAYYKTNKTVEGKALILGLKKITSIPQNLKSHTDRAPHSKRNEKELKLAVQKMKTVAGYPFEELKGSKLSDLQQKIVLVAKL